jgi:hypothetical protein
MKRVSLLLCSVLFLAAAVFAGVTGSISGTVTDTTGAVISGVTVVATNTETGVKSTAETNAQGFYSFPNLPIGHYNVQVEAKGFAGYKETGLVLDVNTALRVDATLRVGTISESIEVSAATAQVDTQSTQMGELIGGREMTSLPLNGRDYTELMALQPGVVPFATAPITYNYSVGISQGGLSISGARESANGFMVNGGNVQEPMAQNVSVVPNLDSIAEFRILTNNFDAEYGHYSGGVINLVTKSGANAFHGNVFEFWRNTNLNAKNFYSTQRNDFRQNQFGGTFGGPIVHDKVFFFVDYQGTRQVLGGAGFTVVPSEADRTGNLADQSQSMTGTVKGQAFADRLTQELGYPVTVGEPFYYSASDTTPACTSSANCVLPNAVIPQSAISPLSANLLKFVPLPNVPASSDFPTGAYTNSTSSSNGTFRDDKGGIRVDANTRFGMVSGYYHIDDYYSFSPDAFTVGAIGSTATPGRSQLVTLGDTKTFNSSSFNEFRFSFMRNAAYGGGPASAPVDPASVGFTTGCDTLGLCPLQSFVTVPSIGLNNFRFGGSGGNYLRENTYQVLDNYSKIIGTHSLKVGGIYALSQLNMTTTIGTGGTYTFNGGAETGLDFADFLLAAPIGFSQGFQVPLYNRGRYYGVYAQDSWRVNRNLTFNYGLRWDVTTPWWEKYNRMEALVPGLQSATFPTAPLGFVMPGDPGVPSTVAPTRYGNVAPRVGLAYSPDPKGGFWQKLTGGAGKTSIRASWGMFYSDLEDVTNALGNGDAPYGLWWSSPNPPQFATPYVDLYTGNVEGQRFPIPLSQIHASPSNPDPTVNWAQFEPISYEVSYYHKNVVPYTENYMLSLQRALGTATVLNMSYVGSQGHHLMDIVEANPSTPSVCLSVSQPSQVAAGSNICGPFSETGTFTTAAGQVIQARQNLSTDFGPMTLFKTMSDSNYNALEVSLRHTSGRLTLLGSYTYSKSMDNASSINDQANPFNPSLGRQLSSFDMTHNFVASYSYELPFDKAFRPNRLTRGWILSGITRFATGTPVVILETDDRSLIGATGGLDGNYTVDEPNYVPGKLLLNTNPRKGGTYFNTSLFSVETLGQLGNARRRFFHGPGINNWDLALLKNIQIKESKTLQLRAEFFNAFNHTQFNSPDGNILDSTFGLITSAGNPRIGQLGVKFVF